MHHVLPVRHLRRRLLLEVGLVTIVGALSIVWVVSSFGDRRSAVVAPAAVASAPTGGGVSSRLQFVGDVFWGRTVQTKALASSLGYKYIVSGLDAADRANYDAWIANFECPITSRDVPLAQQITSLTFNCRPEFLPTLSPWFTAASQANNHTANNGGQWGLDQTRHNLGEAGIQNFGSYDMNDTTDICEVVTLPAKTLPTKRVVGLPVALCGYMYVVDVAPTAAQLHVMQAYAKVMPVIAMPHMGIEYRATAEAAKVAAYHAMIDAGADAVIGAHPHVIQNSESYKGHLIAYSLGNFLFDQQSVSPATTVGLAVDIQLTIHDAKAARIYTQTAPSCQTYKDSCVAQLSKRLVKRPAIAVSYDFACYDESRAAGSVPRLGAPELCDQAKKTATIDQLSTLAHQW